MHIVIIGNGISGISCARYLRKLSDHEITVISGESPYFFSRTALMYIYMGHMRFEDTKPYEDWFWKKNKINLLFDWVENIDFEHDRLQCNKTGTLTYDVLVLATGSKPNMFGWPGQDLKGAQGLYSLQDLQKLESLSPNLREAVIVGGGLIGVELAEMLHSRKIHVEYLVREPSFWGNVLSKPEGELIEDHLQNHGISLRLSTELVSITDDGSGHVRGIVTSDGDQIHCQFVGLCTGVSPNLNLFQNSSLLIGRGVIVDRHFRTNIENVYAIGDCAEFSSPPSGRSKVEQVWYTGKMHGITAAYNICGQLTVYDPGPWFNSAKFFDIEYQTYGEVPPELHDAQADFFWRDKKGLSALRVVWEKSTGQFLGLSSFGLRISHAVMDSWLRQSKNISFIMKNIHLAAFDPELNKDKLPEIKAEFENKHRTS